MALSQETLRDLWHSSPAGRLTPWQQARALALRDVSKEMYGGRVRVNWIASKLRIRAGARSRAGADGCNSHGFLVRLGNCTLV